MNKSYLAKVKIKLIRKGQTIMELYNELKPDMAYNTFYQVLAGQRTNQDVLDKVKAHLGIK